MKPQPEQPSLPQELRLAVAALADKKGESLKVLDLSRVSDFTNHFVVCSGTNRRQVQALSDEVLDRLRSVKRKPLAVEGYQQGTWILIDYGYFLVHIFDPEARDYYRLEGMWSDADDVTQEAGA